MPDCQGREKFIIRTSDRGIFRSCRQRWDWSSKIRQNLEPKSVQRNFDFGTSIHKGLEAYYDPVLCVDTEVRETSAVMFFMQQEYKFALIAAENTPDGFLSDDLKNEFLEREELGIGMLKNYFTWAPAHDKFVPKMVEIEFEVPIPVPPGFDLPHSFVTYYDELYAFCTECQVRHAVVYQGRVDLLVENDYGLWIVDHKTAKQFGNNEWLDLDDQGGSYIWALKQELGLKINGVIYNKLLKATPHPPEVLKSGQLSKNKQQRTTYEMYRQALLAHNQPEALYTDFLQHLREKPNPFFQRIPVRRNETELQTLSQRILIEAIEMLGNPRIYPNPGMFNCMNCAYMVPCVATQDGSDVQYILGTMFKERESDRPETTDEDEPGRAGGPIRL